jgi:hypothetical protein
MMMLFSRLLFAFFEILLDILHFDDSFVGAARAAARLSDDVELLQPWLSGPVGNMPQNFVLIGQSHQPTVFNYKISAFVKICGSLQVGKYTQHLFFHSFNNSALKTKQYFLGV